MYEKFTSEARHIMNLAEHEARRLDHEYAGTEHVLLAIVGENSSLEAEVLESLGVRADAVRAEVEKLVQRGAGPISLQALPVTPRARQVIEFAIEEARYWSQKEVGVEHLLIGLVREQDGMAGQVLRNLGLKPRELAREVLKNRVQQMKIVERAVRPVRAGTPCKRRMREELLAHLTEIYEQELSRLHDPNEAIEEAARRFGDPSELSHELEAALPYHERISHFAERWFAWRPTETSARYSWRLSRQSFCVLTVVLGTVATGILIGYGAVPDVWLLCRFLATTVIAATLAQFLVGVSYYKMRDSMWGVFGSRKSLLAVTLFGMMIIVSATAAFTSLVGIGLWDWTSALSALPLCATGGVVTGIVFLALARFSGPTEIRDMVWACLDVNIAQ